MDAHGEAHSQVVRKALTSQRGRPAPLGTGSLSEELGAQIPAIRTLLPEFHFVISLPLRGYCEHDPL